MPSKVNNNVAVGLNMSTAQVMAIAAEVLRGVCLIDIGAATTDVIVYVNGVVQHAFSLPIAGEQITSDIAIILKHSKEMAEQLKVQYACAYLPLADQAYKYLAEIVEARYTELFELIKQELYKADITNLAALGIIITGGSSKMLGVQELATDIFQTAVSIGIPQHLSGMPDMLQNPCFATGMGLAVQHVQATNRRKKKIGKKFTLLEDCTDVMCKIKYWFQGNF